MGEVTGAPPILSVVLPAFNEAESLPVVLHELSVHLASKTWSYEVLVIDDGSTDGTAETVESLAIEGVRCVRHAINRGKIEALLTGFAVAKGQFVVTMDADGQDDPQALPAILDALQVGGNDVVLVERLGRKHSPLRQFFSRAFGTMWRLFSGSQRRVWTASMMGLSRRVFAPHEGASPIQCYFAALSGVYGWRVATVRAPQRPRLSSYSKFTYREYIRTLIRLLIRTDSRPPSGPPSNFGDFS